MSFQISNSLSFVVTRNWISTAFPFISCYHHSLVKLQCSDKKKLARMGQSPEFSRLQGAIMERAKFIRTTKALMDFCKNKPNTNQFVNYPPELFFLYSRSIAYSMTGIIMLNVHIDQELIDWAYMPVEREKQPPRQYPKKQFRLHHFVANNETCTIQFSPQDQAYIAKHDQFPSLQTHGKNEADALFEMHNARSSF